MSAISMYNRVLMQQRRMQTEAPAEVLRVPYAAGMALQLGKQAMFHEANVSWQTEPDYATMQRKLGRSSFMAKIARIEESDEGSLTVSLAERDVTLYAGSPLRRMFARKRGERADFTMVFRPPVTHED